MTEIKALFGLLYYTSVFKSNHESTDLIFATDGTGREVFRCVTSQKRFLMLLTFCVLTILMTAKKEKKGPTHSYIEFIQFIYKKMSGCLLYR